MCVYCIYTVRGDGMEIILSARSEQPIYEQVYDQIKSQIMDHSLVSGEELPSIRGLAKELKVSVITIKKSYEMLMREGFVHSVKGKGTYVAEIDKEFIQKETVNALRKRLSSISDQAKVVDISLTQLIELLTESYGDH